MRFDAGPRDHLPSGENRAGHLDVVLMKRANVGIVAEKHVSLADGIFRGALVDVLNQVANDGGLIRHLEAHGRERAVGQKETGEKVGRVGHGRGARHALESDPHFFRRREKPRTDDFVKNRVEFAH